jgi:hypothetical protein
LVRKQLQKEQHMIFVEDFKDLRFSMHLVF